MFRVGATTYTVRVMENPIILQGSRCLGLCDDESRTIQLSPTLQVDQRLNVLLHELAHAAIYASGRPTDVESICDFTAMVCEMALTDLLRLGGVLALERLQPGEAMGIPTRRAGLERARYCSCGGMIAPGDVECLQDRLRPERFNIGLYCEHCDHTLRWAEFAALNGLPNGVVVGDPEIEAGCTISRALQPCEDM